MRKEIYMLIFALVCLAGCKPSSQKEKKPMRVITDMAGRKVEIPEKITSIFIDRHSALLVYAFDTVITVNKVFQYNETEKKYLKRSFYENKPYVIEDGADEEIMKLHPDIVLYSQLLTPQNIDKANRLQAKIHIPVVMLDVRIDRYKEIFTFVGGLLGKEDKALELTGFVRKYIDSIPEKAKMIPQKLRHRVYYAEGMNGLQTDPSGSIHSLLLDSVGAVNVAQADVLPEKGMTNVSMEQVYKWNPEIILAWSGNFDGLDSYRTIKTNSVWANIAAVKKHMIYQVPWRPFGWIDRPPGVNRLIGYVWLAHLLYPDVFRFDVNAIAREYFKIFFHYDMSEVEANEILNPQPSIR